MSPETIVQDVMDDISVNYLLEKDPKDIPDDMALSASGQLFSKKKRGVFPIIIDKMYAERKETKQRMLKVKAQKEKLPKSEKKEHYELEKLISQLDSNQLAIKILMNGLYGAMTNAWFRYYDPRIGEAITMTGQLTVRLAEQRVNERLNSILEPKDDYIIAIDTDSIYLNVGKVLSRIKPPTDNYEFCKEFSEKTITPMLKECFVELCNIMHGYENKMNMKLEKISNKAIWVAKKRYVLNVLYNEGVEYDKPKISVTGLDSKKSSTPKVCRTLIEKTLTMILNEDEKTVQAFVKEAKQNFRSLSPEMVASPRSVSDVDKYMSGNTYIKGTPINARGAILYNQLLKDKNVDKIYETIKNGDKIKYIYLKLPNKIKENVIAFKEDMPKEFELHDYIDYDLQFYKSYERPIEQILNAIGWQIKKKGSLRDRF
jgi:DNA polymerase elongation subunit (family B)